MRVPTHRLRPDHEAFPFKQFRKYCIIGTMQAMPPLSKPLSAAVQSFLNYCRVEKGLAANSLSAYTLDLQKLSSYTQKPIRDLDEAELSGYIEFLYRDGLSPRSIA